MQIIKNARSRGSDVVPSESSGHHPVARSVPRPTEEVTPPVRLLLDVAWSLASGVRGPNGPAARLTTTSLLLGMCDLARANLCPPSHTLGLLRDELSGRWDRVATARGMYLEGLRYQEPPMFESSRLSEEALRTLRLSHLLASETGPGPARMRHVLSALLLTPSLPDPTGAHQLLRSLEVDTSGWDLGC